ncbi:hypothetical protein [Arthrobacter sp. 35W]|uniref:hypothetical protein n=1 Tax=Arthrobacter sp. 35W TaxID=1132441 RepID=UPI0004146F3E|nr:hypothetical protein [Arthrobacter sp. 35W]
MEWLWTVLSIAGILAGGAVAVFLLQRSLDKPGGREGMGAMAGAITGMEALINPAAATAREEIEQQSRARAPIPSPGDGLKGIKISIDDDGVPTKVVIPRPTE